MEFLLDTNVMRETASKAPDPKVLAWIEEHTDGCAISALSLGEIWKGIHLLPSGKRKAALTRWADGVAVDFNSVTLDLDPDVLRVWAKLCAKHEAKGNNLGVMDSLIAATAIFHGLTLATRNTKHFPPEVPVVNPWVAG
jgi:predicted nucleic acid-binding protein